RAKHAADRVRHGRACPGHPRLSSLRRCKTWMPATSAGMTKGDEGHMHLDKIDGAPDDTVAWGSDIAAQMLRRLGIPYVSLNPGASYRGLHDSLVNHLGNAQPGMLLCLHEDHTMTIAHSYAKATGEPMTCVLHSNVGLLHG